MSSDAQNPSRQDTERALRDADLFASVDVASISDLAAHAHRRSWAEGAILFQRGDEESYLLVFTSGRVRLAMSSADGKELVLGHVGPGEVLGEFSLIDGKPRSADATAIAPTSAIVLHREAFLGVARERADLGLALARHLCAKLRNTNYQMESIALYELRARVARFLFLTLHQHLGITAPDEVELRLDLNQGELAAMLGASRPKVNKVLQMLHAEGVLRRDGQRTLCSRAKLADLLADDAWPGLV